jgi:hypothetical protein
MTHDELKAKALAVSEVRAKYEALAAEFDLRRHRLLCFSSLNNAYGDDEPDYPLNLIKEENSDYEGLID